MKRLVIASMAVLALASAAAAQTVTYEDLSIHEVQDLLAGYSVDQNGIYIYVDGTDTRDLPDVTVPVFGEVEVIDKPAVHNPRSEPHARLGGNIYGQIEGKSHHWNEKCQTIADVNADCTVLSMNPGSSGMPATYKKVTAQVGTETQDGGTEDVAVCSYSEADLDFDWQSGFDVTITTTTSDGSC